MNISRRVASVSGFPVQFNKAIVGKNAFAHESGIHQDGMLKNAETFEIMRPEDVGLSETNLVRANTLAVRPYALNWKIWDMCWPTIS